jgi:hypothetical protein
MAAQQPEVSLPPSIKDETRSIACVICQAVYAPSQRHEHLLLAPAALESAFMGMCHFCFRCRRPACPECWDDVHGICGRCGSESQLPFRREVGPLSSQLFTASRQAQLERETAALLPVAPLVCITPGAFHRSLIEQRATAPIPAIVQGMVSKPGRRGTTQTIPAVKIDEMRTRPEAKSRRANGFQRIVLALLSIVLVLLILLVVAVFISEDINIFIVSTLHVDIRAEIAYLWQLITHLF